MKERRNGRKEEVVDLGVPGVAIVIGCAIVGSIVMRISSLANDRRSLVRARDIAKRGSATSA